MKIIAIFSKASYPGDVVKTIQMMAHLEVVNQWMKIQLIVSEAALWMKCQPRKGATPLEKNLTWNSVAMIEIKQLPHNKINFCIHTFPMLFIPGICPHRLCGLDLHYLRKLNVFYANYPSHGSIKSNGLKKTIKWKLQSNQYIKCTTQNWNSTSWALARVPTTATTIMALGNAVRYMENMEA